MRKEKKAKEVVFQLKMGDIEGKKEVERNEESLEAKALSSYVQDIFNSFRSARVPFELQWQEAWRNFLGEYQTNTRWAKTEGDKTVTSKRSRLFIKLTSLKCHTAHAKIMDAGFNLTDGLPFDLESVEETLAGLNEDDVKDMLAQANEQLEGHFKEINLVKKLSSAILELTIFGSGVLKGPITSLKSIKNFKPITIEGQSIRKLGLDTQMNPFEKVIEKKVLPEVCNVNLFSFYTDPNAETLPESIAQIEFTRMLPAKFMKFATTLGFKREKVIEVIEEFKTDADEKESFFKQLSDNYTGKIGEKDNKISVLEFWGLVPVKLLREAGCKEIPEGLHELETIEALVVLAGTGKIIKACVNPLDDDRPYYLCPYREIPNQVYGEGVAQAMRDSQMMVNSAARMYVDNKALSGNVVPIINIDKIDSTRTTNFDIYPGKTIFVKNVSKASDAVDQLHFNDTTQGLRELIDMFSNFADEETSLPKFASGGAQSPFLNKTATGISILSAASNIAIKSVMQNIDDYFIEPLVLKFHEWFMDNGTKKDTKIPVKVVATGTHSLIAKEIKLEKLDKFIATLSNSNLFDFVDIEKAIKEYATLLDMDILKSAEEVKALIKSIQEAKANPPRDNEFLDLDRLFPELTESEKVQLLQQRGITPDPKRVEAAKKVQLIADQALQDAQQKDPAQQQQPQQPQDSPQLDTAFKQDLNISDGGQN